jgi:hypothetical protein
MRAICRPAIHSESLTTIPALPHSRTLRRFSGQIGGSRRRNVCPTASLEIEVASNGKWEIHT